MNNVIVGSGISGLFAGLLLSEKGHKVTIIEKEIVKTKSWLQSNLNW